MTTPTPRTDAVEIAHGLAWFGLHDERGRYLDGMVKFRELARLLELELNAERATSATLASDLAAAQSALAAKDAEWDALKSHADALAKEVHHLNWAPESALNAYLYAYPKKDAP